MSTTPTTPEVTATDTVTEDLAKNDLLENSLFVKNKAKVEAERKRKNDEVKREYGLNHKKR